MQSISPAQSEAMLLQMLVPHLEAEGFQVFLSPARSVLPAFMRGYQPDAIALREDKKLAIEVKTRIGKTKTPMHKLSEMFAEHPDWELRIIYAPAQDSDQPITTIPRERVVKDLDRLLDIFDTVGPVPALLTGWSVLEAAARSVATGNLQRPQTSARLLEMLASNGYITPEEASALRKVAILRNEAAHGQLDVAITREQIGDLVTVCRTLLDLSTADA